MKIVARSLADYFSHREELTRLVDGKFATLCIFLKKKRQSTLGRIESLPYTNFVRFPCSKFINLDPADVREKIISFLEDTGAVAVGHDSNGYHKGYVLFFYEDIEKAMEVKLKYL